MPWLVFCLISFVFVFFHFINYVDQLQCSDESATTILVVMALRKKVVLEFAPLKRDGKIASLFSKESARDKPTLKEMCYNKE